MISEEKQVGDYTFVVISDEGLSHKLNNIPKRSRSNTRTVFSTPSR